jgi:hypothetical protein
VPTKVFVLLGHLGEDVVPLSTRSEGELADILTPNDDVPESSKLTKPKLYVNGSVIMNDTVLLELRVTAPFIRSYRRSPSSSRGRLHDLAKTVHSEECREE